LQTFSEYFTLGVNTAATLVCCVIWPFTEHYAEVDWELFNHTETLCRVWGWASCAVEGWKNRADRFLASCCKRQL